MLTGIEDCKCHSFHHNHYFQIMILVCGPCLFQFNVKIVYFLPNLCAAYSSDNANFLQTWAYCRRFNSRLGLVFPCLL